METFLIKAAQLIAALAFLVIVHEFGHYIFARIFGIKVEKFYLFFNPWFSLVKWKPKPRPLAPGETEETRRPSWRDTEYGIGWLPLGGYCKIAGMIDESMDREQMAQPAKPWEFRSKAAYKRLLVMAGGVLFNFILAILIYAGMAWYWGTKYIPLERMEEGMDFVPAAQEAGFRNGDRPYMADGKLLDAADSDMMLRMLEAKTVTVIRNGSDTVDIAIPDGFVFRINEAKGFMAMRVPVVVDRTVSGEAAEKAGIQVGDRVIAVDTIRTPSYTELSPALEKYAERPVDITLLREGREVHVEAPPNKYGKLGFQLRQPTDVYEPVIVEYNLLEAFPQGVSDGTTMLTNYAGSLKHIFSKEGAESLGGFGAIGDMFPEKWNWMSFWSVTAFLSVALAIMNILPIPGLDGGHIMFLLWEVVTRRKVPEKVMEWAQMIGMAFLLLLLLYANMNDIFRSFFK